MIDPVAGPEPTDSGDDAGLGLPAGALDLLARAALAPQAEALRAWQAWRRGWDIETTPWNEVRMLGAVAGRIAWLEPDAAIRPRILGIRKFLWVQGQMVLRTALSGLRALDRAGIPMLLMKGLSRIVADPAAAQERLIRDVDVLVPPALQAHAEEILAGDGWALREEPWHAGLHRLSPLAGHHAWTLRKDKAEIDLHHFSNHLNRLWGDDDGLWRRARRLTWNGIRVHVPAPADALLIALVHGVRWSRDRAADWAVDSAAILDAGGVDWPVFIEEVQQRELGTILEPALVWLRDELQRPVPSAVTDSLAAIADPMRRTERSYYNGGSLPRSVHEQRAAAGMAFRRAMRRSGGRLLSGDGQYDRQALSRREIELAPGRHAFAFDVAGQDRLTSWLWVQATLRLPAKLIGHRAHARFSVPGLRVASVSSDVGDAGQGWGSAVFNVHLPAAFIALRFITRMNFEHIPPATHTDDGTRRPLIIQTWAMHPAAPG